MKFVVCFFINIIAFLFLFLYDLSQVRKRKFLSALCSIIGYGGVGASLFFLFLWFPLCREPAWLNVVSLTLAGVCFLLLLFTQFLEIPFHASLKGTAERRVCRSGSYGVVRHPGFWWFFFMLLLLNGAFRQGKVLILSALSVTLNFALVLWEDRLIFPRIFTDYGEYQAKVPFLLPKFSRDTEMP